jgi:cellulose biosynthesis protein BcsQ
MCRRQPGVASAPQRGVGARGMGLSMTSVLERIIRREQRASGRSYTEILRDLQSRSSARRHPRPMIVSFLGLKGGLGRTTLSMLSVAQRSASGRVLLVSLSERESCDTSLCRRWIAMRSAAGMNVDHVVLAPEQVARGELWRHLDGHEVVIIDTVRSYESQFAALMASDLGVVLSGTSPLEIWRLGAAVKLVTEVRRHRRDVGVVGAIVNHRARDTALGATRRVVREALGDVMDTSLGQSVHYSRACWEAEEPIGHLRRYAPTWRAGVFLAELFGRAKGKGRVRTTVPPARHDPLTEARVEQLESERDETFAEAWSSYDPYPGARRTRIA